MITALEAYNITKDRQTYVFSLITSAIDAQIRGFAACGGVDTLFSQKDIDALNTIPSDYESFDFWVERLKSHYQASGFKAQHVNAYHMYEKDALEISWDLAPTPSLIHHTQRIKNET